MSDKTNYLQFLCYVANVHIYYKSDYLVLFLSLYFVVFWHDRIFLSEGSETNLWADHVDFGASNSTGILCAWKRLHYRRRFPCHFFRRSHGRHRVHRRWQEDKLLSVCSFLPYSSCALFKFCFPTSANALGVFSPLLRFLQSSSSSSYVVPINRTLLYIDGCCNIFYLFLKI